MRGTLTKTIVGSISMVLVVTSLALAGGPGRYDDSLTYARGMVIAVDAAGLATVQTDQGVHYQVPDPRWTVQTDQGVHYQVPDPRWEVGKKVDCITQDSYTLCDNRAAFVQ
jgi:hypothetical protein